MSFADAFGRPGEGIHMHIAGVAVLDIVFTLVAAWIIAWTFHMPFWIVAMALIVGGEAAHFVAGVDTAGTRILTKIVELF